MSYVQIKDVIGRLRDLHERIARFYDTAHERFGEERARLMLDDMSRRERDVAASLGEFLEKGEPNVLETWLQYEPDAKLEEWVTDVNLDPGLGSDAVFRRVMEIEDRISNVHRQLAAISAAPAVEELFESLVVLDESRRRRYSRDVLESP